MVKNIASHPDAASFNATVWKIVRLIPAGKVSTYGQIAALIPAPEGMPQQDYETCRSRWVGYAMAESPADVPWQRVINSQGKISLKSGPNPGWQRQLLEAEGVVFDSHERVDLVRFGWLGPSAEWLEKNGLIPPPQEYQQPLLFG